MNMSPNNVVARILGVAILIIIFFMMLVLDAYGVMKIMESIANLLLIVIGVLLTIAFELIVFPQKFVGKLEKTETVEKEVPKLIDPRFVHLTIHYSQRTDTPDTLHPARPRLIVYYEKKRYYWVPTWLEPYIKQHKLNWHSHDGEKALRTWLKLEKIEPHETDPSPKDLDLENLLETDRLSVEPKKSMGKVEEKSPLIEVYSPIHAMIIRIYGEVPHSPRDTVGSWVKKSLIDVNTISALFKQHVHELGDNNLKMWLEIEKDIEERNGFFLTIYRQKWFDELEAEYNRLTKH
jgi:hypothetical protein